MQMGLSESSRVTTAEQSRYRVDYANSRQRTTRVVALDDASLPTLEHLATLSWNDAAFFRLGEKVAGGDDTQLLSLSGESSLLSGQAEIADVLVMVVSAGAVADRAPEVGQAFFSRRKLTTGLILNSADVPDQALMQTLVSMRPYAAMLVVASGDDHVADMLQALRA